MEKSYEAFYHIVFLELCKSLEIIPTGFCIKITPCVGNPSKNFLLLWERELAAAQLNLPELLILEYVQKLFVLETKFNSKFTCYTVQEYWLLKARNHLEKYEKQLPLEKLKKIRKLVGNEDLYFPCLGRFESHYEFFQLKFRFYNFCENFIPDFENLHYLLH